MNKLSIYELIVTNIDVDGKLPQTFSLEEENDPNQIKFMIGAMDGILAYHSAGGNEKKAKKVITLLRKYFETGKEKYIAGVELVLSDNSTISVIDPIRQNIRDNQKDINMGRIFELSLHIVKTSDNIEMVKLGMGLLGLFDIDESDEVRGVITTLSLYEEFTLYAVAAAVNWASGNDVIYKIAKRFTGWGKIHAVEFLEPESEEIREWILRNGCSNDVMDSYLGLTCAIKGDLISALRQDTMDDTLFDSIVIIVDALLNEGPVLGISVYEHAEEALLLFMHYAQKYVDDIENLWCILNVRDWAENSEIDYKEEILSQCDEIITQLHWKEKIVNAITECDNEFKLSSAVNAASSIGIDISDELFTIFKSDPIKYSWYSQLLENSNIAIE